MWLTAPLFGSATVVGCYILVADTDRVRNSTVKQDVILKN